MIKSFYSYYISLNYVVTIYQTPWRQLPEGGMSPFFCFAGHGTVLKKYEGRFEGIMNRMAGLPFEWRHSLELRGASFLICFHQGG